MFPFDLLNNKNYITTDLEKTVSAYDEPFRFKIKIND